MGLEDEAMQRLANMRLTSSLAQGSDQTSVTGRDTSESQELQRLVTPPGSQSVALSAEIVASGKVSLAKSVDSARWHSRDGPQVAGLEEARDAVRELICEHAARMLCRLRCSVR